MKADAATEAAVQAVLDRLAEVYRTRDATLLQAVFAPDPDVVMFSPGASERFVGISEIVTKARSDWARSESASLVYRETSISAAGPVAWAAVDADFTVRAAGEERTLPVHITFVLERRDDEWRIAHAHYSTA
jgi:uncharacterized protein (TIGR02246 family)